jgi:hypothetical protein
MDIGDVINSVRTRVGLNEVAKTTAALSDKFGKAAQTLLNEVLQEISNQGDWQEMVTAVQQAIACSVTNYSLCATNTWPSNLCKNIYEIAVSATPQPLRYCNLAAMNRYQRGGSTGEPRFWTVKGVDENRNPRWEVWPTPATADADKKFIITYFLRPKIQTLVHLSGSTVEGRVVASADCPFDSQLVINGLYTRVLEEEAGGGASRESMACYRTYTMQMQEELNRYNADSGSGEPTQLSPS